MSTNLQIRQPWPLIVAMTVFSFLFINSGLIWASWDWFSQCSTLQDHLPWWRDILKGFVFTSYDDWYEYQDALYEMNCEADIVLHLAIPSVFSFLLALYLSLKACWADEDHGVVHIFGPRLYKEKNAIRHAKVMAGRMQK